MSSEQTNTEEREQAPSPVYEYRFVAPGGCYTYGTRPERMNLEQARECLAENIQKAEKDRNFRGYRITDEFLASIHLERRTVGSWVPVDEKGGK